MTTSLDHSWLKTYNRLTAYKKMQQHSLYFLFAGCIEAILIEKKKKNYITQSSQEGRQSESMYGSIYPAISEIKNMLIRRVVNSLYGFIKYRSNSTKLLRRECKKRRCRGRQTSYWFSRAEYWIFQITCPQSGMVVVDEVCGRLYFIILGSPYVTFTE